MTLKVLLSVIRRYWVGLLVCVLICTAAGLAYGLTRPVTYSATAVVASNLDVRTLKGQADIVVGESNIKGVSAAADTAAYSVRITARDSSPKELVDRANAVAEDVANVARGMSLFNSDDSTPQAVTVNVSPAKETAASKRNPGVYAIMGCAGGVLVALCIVVFVASRKAPVCDATELEELTHLPVLGTMPADEATSLLGANVIFAAESFPRSICVVPAKSASASNTARLLEALLRKASAERGTGDAVRIVAGKSLLDSADTAFAVHDADATLLVVAEWDDSLRDVESALHELTIAKANTLGIVFVRA